MKDKNCNDCGEDLEAHPACDEWERVCRGCWSNRLRVCQALQRGELQPHEFRNIQACVSRGNGTAAGMVREYLGGAQ